MFVITKYPLIFVFLLLIIRINIIILIINNILRLIRRSKTIVQASVG